MSYRFADSLRAVSSWSCSHAVWHIPLLCVEWKTPDDGQRICAKHVEFYSKNKFEKLVHLVGYIIRIYHDARSPGRQILSSFHFYIPMVQFNSVFLWNVFLLLMNPSYKQQIILSNVTAVFCIPSRQTRESNMHQASNASFRIHINLK